MSEREFRYLDHGNQEKKPNKIPQIPMFMWKGGAPASARRT